MGQTRRIGEEGVLHDEEIGGRPAPAPRMPGRDRPSGGRFRRYRAHPYAPRGRVPAWHRNPRRVRTGFRRPRPFRDSLRAASSATGRRPGSTAGRTPMSQAPIWLARSKRNCIAGPLPSARRTRSRLASCCSVARASGDLRRSAPTSTATLRFQQRGGRSAPPLLVGVAAAGPPLAAPISRTRMSPGTVRPAAASPATIAARLAARLRLNANDRLGIGVESGWPGRKHMQPHLPPARGIPQQVFGDVSSVTLAHDQHAVAADHLLHGRAGR